MKCADVRQISAQLIIKVKCFFSVWAPLASKQWPIARELFVFTNGAPAGGAKAFVDYLLDPGKGQKNVLEVGYVPLGK